VGISDSQTSFVDSLLPSQTSCWGFYGEGFYTMPRFIVGELVELNGLLAKLHGGALGMVVSVVPHKDGVTELDEYKIEFEDSRQLRLWSFQLTPSGINQRRVAIDH